MACRGFQYALHVKYPNPILADRQGRAPLTLQLWSLTLLTNWPRQTLHLPRAQRAQFLFWKSPLDSLPPWNLVCFKLLQSDIGWWTRKDAAHTLALITHPSNHKAQVKLVGCDVACPRNVQTTARHFQPHHWKELQEPEPGMFIQGYYLVVKGREPGLYFNWWVHMGHEYLHI